MTPPDRRPQTFLESFSRSQIAAGIATAADYGVLFGLTEIFHIWYVASTAIGAGVGALTNFLLNRHWSFRANHDRWHGQAMRYTVVSIGSLLLNAAGVYFVTEFAKVHYSISVILVSVIVGVLFNFPLQRHYVFR